MSPVTETHTASASRRRRSSLSMSSSRSSASSPGLPISALRMTRTACQLVTSMPGKSMCDVRGDHVLERARSGRRRRRRSAAGFAGTLIAREAVLARAGCRTFSASERLWLEMNGNGCAGSTTSGVSTGKMALLEVRGYLRPGRRHRARRTARCGCRARRARAQAPRSSTVPSRAACGRSARSPGPAGRRQSARRRSG